MIKNAMWKQFWPRAIWPSPKQPAAEKEHSPFSDVDKCISTTGHPGDRRCCCLSLPQKLSALSDAEVVGVGRSMGWRLGGVYTADGVTQH